MTAKGFAPRSPAARRYWMQAVMVEGDDQWVPLYAPLTRQQAYRRCAEQMRNPAVDYVLLLRGNLEQGAIASNDAILADFQREAVPGAKVIRV